MKTLYSNVEELKERLTRVTLPEEFDLISEELKNAEREAQLEINRANLNKEERERKEFEKAKAQHMALISEYESIVSELAEDEHTLIKECMEFIIATKERWDTLAKSRGLVQTINQHRAKFGTSEVTPIELYSYQSLGFDWESLARAILERGIELVKWNEMHPEHEQKFTVRVMQNPNLWGVKRIED